MSREPASRIEEPAGTAESPAPRVLIVQPNEDVGELLAEHCRRLGMAPLTQGPDANGQLPDVDLIVAEPASIEAQRTLAAHERAHSEIPIVFVSVYPPAGSLLDSPAAAYLVLPCSRERFARAVAGALAGTSSSAAASRSCAAVNGFER